MKSTAVKMVTRAYKIVFVALVLAIPSLSRAHGTFHEQIAELNRRIEQEPNNADLFLARGELYRHHEDWPAAQADYDRVLALENGRAEVELYRGKLFFDCKQFDKAKEAVERFLAAESQHPEALLLRARIHAESGEFMAAVEDYSAAIALNESPQPEHYLERATAMISMGQDYLAEAVIGLDEGIRRLGPVVTLQLAAIDLETQMGHYDVALRLVEKMAKQSKFQARWQLQRAEILQRAGRVDQARVALQQGLAEVERLPQQRRQLPAVVRLEQQLHESLAALEPAEKISTALPQQHLQGMPDHWVGTAMKDGEKHEPR